MRDPCKSVWGDLCVSTRYSLVAVRDLELCRRQTVDPFWSQSATFERLPEEQENTSCKYTLASINVHKRWRRFKGFQNSQKALIR